jgi:hypothetical protein
VIVLSQDFQHHSLWSFCDCPEQPRLPTPFDGVGSLCSGQSQKHNSEWCWKSLLWTITKRPQRMVLEVLAQDNHKKSTANGVGSLGSGQSQKDHIKWCWKSWLLWTITKRPQRVVLEVLALDNHKKTTANGVGSLGSGQSQKDHSEWSSNTIRCGLFVIVQSQDFQHHLLWSFCDCPEPRLPTPFAVVFL